VADGQAGAAWRHALACGARPLGQAAPLPGEGVWWHGLWQVWLALGDPARADQARAAGLAWMDHTREHHLPGEFSAGFVDQVPAHRGLASGTPGAAA